MKLSLKVSDALNARLENLARGMGGTKSDVLRRAIALIEVAEKARAQNQTVCIVENGKVILEIVTT